ncbi:hypothetical protein [Streptococcus gordonii]|nr:Uncharacterised protein [Streptococcus gordonii]
MPIVNSAQPDFIQINSNLRLRAYDGHYQVPFLGIRIQSLSI